MQQFESKTLTMLGYEVDRGFRVGWRGGEQYAIQNWTSCMSCAIDSLKLWHTQRTQLDTEVLTVIGFSTYGSNITNGFY